jgi:GDPmannose 4,6-dehydratase
MSLSALKENTAAGKSALITGITGQDGFYLAELLLSKGYEVFGLLRGQNNPKAAGLTRDLPALKLVSGDLVDASSLIRALRFAQPDEVYNLGACSLVPYSWINPRLVADVNGVGVLNMLEAIRFHQDLTGQQVRFYQASTSEMFGKVQESVQSETTLLWPRSPYGVAKAYGHHMTINYRESYGMHASSGILFNHESPRRGVEFVTRKVSHGVARISLGLQDTIALGTLDSQRDWGFAGDYVEAMYLMLQQDQGDDYVIATGETHSIAELLDAAFSVVGIADWTPYVEIDPAFVRPAEVDVLVGDASKAASVLGWKPKVSFLELVEMMVHSDIERQSSGDGKERLPAAESTRSPNRPAPYRGAVISQAALSPHMSARRPMQPTESV